MVGRVRDPGRRQLAVALMIAVLAALAGCSGSGNSAAGTTSITAGTTTITAGTVTTQVRTTVTSTAAGAATTAKPPAPTAEPPPVDGTCPYLSDTDVADINGQHTGTTQIITVAPQPICVFYRSDGGYLATVRIIKAATPQSAVAAVDAHVPIDKSNPASKPAGWTGGSMVTDTGSVYAVSKGTVAVIAESNQQQSVKGRQMAITAIANLGL